MNYIHVTLRTDEDNLMGSDGWGEYNEKDSITAYGNAVEAAILEAYPGVEVEVTTYGRNNIETDVPAADADTINAIIDQVWQSWEWLRK